MKFLVHGSIAYDLLIHYEGSFVDGIDPKNLDSLSVGYLAHRFEKHHGGTAANIAWALNMLGQEPHMVGAVGSDGDPYLSMLRERGIPTDLVVKVKDALTATAIIATDNSEHQITFFHPGADAKGALPAMDQLADEMKYGIVSPRDSIAMLQAAKEMKRLGIRFLFDPGQQTQNFTQDELRGAVSASNGLVVNDYEWTLASERLSWSQEKVVEACGLLIVTHGEKGMVLRARHETALVPACKPDKVVNPVGAGDAVRAGLMIGLAGKWSLTETGRLCNALGSLAVEQEGAMLDSLDMKTLRDRIVANYKEDVPAF